MIVKISSDDGDIEDYDAVIPPLSDADQASLDEFLVNRAIETVGKENLDKPEVVSGLQTARRKLVAAALIIMHTALQSKSDIGEAKQ